MPVLTDTEWERRLPLVSPAADAGGDDQISEAFDARWAKPMDDGNWALVTRYYYLVDRDGRVFLEEQTEYMHCRDLADPGGSEIWCDYRYVEWAKATADPETEAENAEPPLDDEWYEVVDR